MARHATPKSSSRSANALGSAVPRPVSDEGARAPHPPHSPQPRVYLASQSPRRQELLTQLGWSFELLLPKSLSDLAGLKGLRGLRGLVALAPGGQGDWALHRAKPSPAPSLSQALEDLERPQAGEGALAYVQRVTRLKFELARLSALSLGAAYRPSSPILCADTTVALGGEILGKPQSSQEARSMLQALSGRTHRVYTSVVVGGLRDHQQRLSRSWVSFAPMSASAIEGYVQTQEWRGKAGGYAVQGLAAAYIEEIRGSYSGIMGLPLFECASLLEDYGRGHGA